AFGQNLPRRWREPQQCPCGLRLPGPGLAHDPEPFLAHLEGHAAHGFNQAGTQMEAHSQIFDLEEGSLRHFSAFGSRTSRRPSPSKLKPSETTKIAIPGMVATHQ